MYPQQVWVLYTATNRYLVDASKVKDVAQALNDSKNAGIRLENYQRRIPRFDVVNIEIKDVCEGVQEEIDKLKQKALWYNQETQYIWLDDYIKTPAIN